MQFADVVPTRRTVRHFAPDPVDRDVLERIAATAQRAPSAGFSQGQRIVIVTEPGRKRRLAELVSEGYYTERGFDPWISEDPAVTSPQRGACQGCDRSSIDGAAALRPLGDPSPCRIAPPLACRAGEAQVYS